MFINLFVTLFIFTASAFAQEPDSHSTCDKLTDTLQQQEVIMLENPESKKAFQDYNELMAKYVSGCFPYGIEPDSVYEKNMRKYITPSIRNNTAQDTLYQKNMRKILGY